jgi:arginyl-tRNA synthetase
MLILDRLRERFAAALPKVAARFSAPDSSLSHDDVQTLSGQVRATADPRFGDYQANCAMPLAKLLGKPPRDIAAAITECLEVEDLCDPVEIAGPGFINLRLRDAFLAQAILTAVADDRLGIAPAPSPQTVLIDYSSPNVAKPMHVGHIRSTVIGDALARIFRFLGHHVITDNHLGDWGTQFGMVIYGFKHFGNESALAANPVGELSRLYRLVNRLIEYHAAKSTIEAARQAVAEGSQALLSAGTAAADGKGSPDKKKLEKALAAATRKRDAALERLEKLESAIGVAQADDEFVRQAEQHPQIATAVLKETALLHQGDSENLALWSRFLPYCKDEINRVYDRLGVSFDHTLGESFYHSMLGDVVATLQRDGLAKESDGAVCVFLPGFDSPMIVQKKDGAYLYATTDLATLFYRREHFSPDEILYVVDTRQSEHFEKLFALAKAVGFDRVKLVHVNFGTVLGSDGRPFKTRSGTSVGLDSLLDEAVARAMAVVCDPQRAAKLDPPLSEREQQEIADVVGLGAIKHADLSHHRTSDYKFDLEKMVSLDGNTSAYVQYAYARVQGILQKGDVDSEQLIRSVSPPQLSSTAERTLALTLLRFGECLEQVRGDYAPNFLVDYLYDAAKAYAVFNDNCPVLKSGDEELTRSRLILVLLTGQVLRKGLELLGIKVVLRM